MRYRLIGTALAVLAALCAGSSLASAQEPLARIRVSPTVVEWEPLVTGYDRLVLTVTGSCGVLHREFTEGSFPSVKLADLGDGRDGSYSWELRLVPKLTSEVLRALQTGRKNNDACVVDRLQEEGKLPGLTAQSGSVAIFRGAFVPQDQDGEKSAAESDADEPEEADAAAARPGVSTARKGGMTFATGADQVIPDDLIVQGSQCVGFDCVNNESFGFDTIRLKENNLRIKFEDTSVGTFPTNDWQLTANDSASGGASKFSIDDVTGGKTPFTITAGAATNSIFVSSSGRVGFRTATPVLDLHVNDSDTPAIRLEQNGSGGFTAQTWDIGANEANFFVRDVTGGSRLPFRIRPGAPTSSIDIAADGDVGIGTASPQAKLHVFSGEVRFPPGVNAAAGNNTHFNFALDGKNYIRGTTIIADNGGNVGMGGQTNPAHPLHMGSGAHVTAGGTWTNASSRDYKEDIQTLSASDAMATLEGLTPVTYKYKNTENEHRVGFIAEDVPELVAEEDRRSLAPMDVVAVLTKVVQEQQKLVRDQQKTIDELAAKVAELEKARNAGN
ncbi:MAG TPA: tail fiber domain-containing protein [Thermoanaerobaculia bacterium]|nr:tail fiber domain-containing protein [Thermoanaerobaculia bacterium]